MQHTSHAVVIGAGVAGLLAARVLADHHDHVTVIDRDRLPDSDDPRRGVPQGGHVHVLMPRGAQALDELLPGVLDELLRAGAVPVDPAVDSRVVIGGHRLRATPVGASAVQASRPFLERRVRERVRTLPGVDVRAECDVVGLCVDERGSRATGVRVLRRAPGSAVESVPAGLVVDASGRGSRLPVWLAGLGFDSPAEERPRVDVGYCTRRLRSPAPDVEAAVLVGPVAGNARTAVLTSVEGGGRLLTLAGFGPANHPPTDDEGFLAFTDSVAPPDVAAAIRSAGPAPGGRTYRFPAYQRRHYRRSRRFPDGLLVLGDALCSLNPVYAQGMTVAALEALALRRCLADGRDGLVRRFSGAVTPIVDGAWRLGTASDLALPEVEGKRPATVRVLNAYLDRLLTVAEHDPVVARAFGRVIGLLDPPTGLTRPAVAHRVLRARRATGTTSGAVREVSPRAGRA